MPSWRRENWTVQIRFRLTIRRRFSVGVAGMTGTSYVECAMPCDGGVVLALPEAITRTLSQGTLMRSNDSIKIPDAGVGLTLVRTLAEPTSRSLEIRVRAVMKSCHRLSNFLNRRLRLVGGGTAT